MADLEYTPTEWVHGGPPAIDADTLNNIEQGIVQVTDAVNAMPGFRLIFMFGGS